LSCCCVAACTPDGNGITYNERINVALAVAMPDGGLITPVLKDADKVDIYQLSRCAALLSLVLIGSCSSKQ
jgi:pyruvate/2-oxoglutarate dehydrogenase complex dihydrolipoamide acyltransferase (E2) component